MTLALAIAIRFDVVAIGVMAGLGYAVLAAGLVLVYRSTKIINLAHGQIGAFSAVVLIEMVNYYGLPYVVGVPIAILSGVAVALAVERWLVRPLEQRSPLAVLVGTIGVTQILLVAGALAPKVIGKRFPVPVDFTREFHGLVLHGEHVTILVAAPIVLGVFTIFLTRTRYGLAIRAVAANRDAAMLAGIEATKVARTVWVASGALAAFAAILTFPLAGGAGTALSPALGPGLLLRALAAGLVGRLTSLPRTVGAGIAIGVLEAVLFASYPSDLGLVDVALFVAILAMLLLRGRDTSDGAASFSFGHDPQPLSAEVASLPKVKLARRVGYLVVAVVALGAPLVYTTSSNLYLLSRIPIFAIIGISIVILTGWAGQLSLGQMAFVGFGAMGTAALGSRGVPFGAATGYMLFAGTLLAVAVGAPALRLRGLLLTVTTLAFAIATTSYLLPLELFRSSSVDTAVVTPGKLGPLDFGSYRTGYYMCVGALVIVVLLARRIRSTGIGRAILAVEGNEQSAAAMTISPAVVKLRSFAIAGALAVLAGALLAGVARTFQINLFSPDQSLQVLAMTVVGGVGSIGGAVLGAIYLIGVPNLLGNSATVQLATSGIGLLVILRLEPAGLAGVMQRLRDVLVRMLGGSSNSEVDPTAPDVDIISQASAGVARVRTIASTRSPDSVPLDLREVSVTLGGRRIVNGVSLHVGRDEIVGLIGSNGAGKTTLMNAVSGFVPSSGVVELEGTELNRLAPHERARLGLARSFQAALLYPRLTTRECVQVALEARERSELIPSLLALPPAVRAERRNRAAADDLIALVGLAPFADLRAGVLSTGTRRILELACIVATQPDVILLDEPLAGVAQKETEAFGPLIVNLRRELGVAMLIIEHNLPMICSISDRLYCLETGSVIAEGEPEEVRGNERVIASYLGTDERAINRSAPRTAVAKQTRKPTNGTKPTPRERAGSKS